jgi:hypothetical protein
MSGSVMQIDPMIDQIPMRMAVAAFFIANSPVAREYLP